MLSGEGVGAPPDRAPVRGTAWDVAATCPARASMTAERVQTFVGDKHSLYMSRQRFKLMERQRDTSVDPAASGGLIGDEVTPGSDGYGSASMAEERRAEGGGQGPREGASASCWTSWRRVHAGCQQLAVAGHAVGERPGPSKWSAGEVAHRHRPGSSDGCGGAVGGCGGRQVDRLPSSGCSQARETGLKLGALGEEASPP